jgi:hypothetical protein
VLPRQEIIDRFLEAAQLHQQAAAALDNTDDPNRVKRALYLHNAGKSCVRAAQEAQKEKPRQEIIARFLEAAPLYQQAAAALDKMDNPNSVKRAHYLGYAGTCLVSAAKEAQEENPDQTKISNLLRRAKELKEHAAALYSYGPMSWGVFWKK